MLSGLSVPPVTSLQFSSHIPSNPFIVFSHTGFWCRSLVPKLRPVVEGRPQAARAHCRAQEELEVLVNLHPPGAAFT